MVYVCTQVGYTHRHRQWRWNRSQWLRVQRQAQPRREKGEEAAAAEEAEEAAAAAAAAAAEEDSAAAARYEEGKEGEDGPTLLAPACFGRGGSYAVVRLGRAKRKEGGPSLWVVKDVSFERVR